MDFSTKPLQPIERLTKPLIRFLHIEAASGVILIVVAAFAILVANSSLYETYLSFWNMEFTLGVEEWSLSYPLWYWVNDGLMTFFFFLVGLEIKREIVLGELQDVRRIISPAAAAIGGVVLPIIIFLFLLGDQPGQQGWAIPMATDIAFVVGALALLGKRVPHGLKVFLLTLAIVDDILAVLVIAIFYSTQISFSWLFASLVGIAVVVGMNRVGVRTVVGYLIVGTLIWLCTLKSGIHPTISGVVLGLITPALPLVSKDKLKVALDRLTGLIQNPIVNGVKVKLKDVVEEMEFITRESISPLERFESYIHPWAAFIIMPIFALANTAVPFSFSAMTSSMSTAVAMALFVGKPLGVVLGLFLVVKLKVGFMPGGTNWGAVIGAGCLAGIGFTMSLFVASLSLKSELLIEAKTGILVGSTLSGVVGMIVLMLFLKKKSDSEQVQD